MNKIVKLVPQRAKNNANTIRNVYCVLTYVHRSNPISNYGFILIDG